MNTYSHLFKVKMSHNGTGNKIVYTINEAGFKFIINKIRQLKDKNRYLESKVKVRDRQLLELKGLKYHNKKLKARVECNDKKLDQAKLAIDKKISEINFIIAQCEIKELNNGGEQ